MSSPLWSGSGYQGRHGGDSLRRMAAMPAPDGNPIPKPAPTSTVPAVEEQAPEVTVPAAEEIPQPVPAVCASLIVVCAPMCVPASCAR